MSILMRSPKECASWEWELDEFATPGLNSALMVAARMSAVLRQYELLEPRNVEWHWLIHGIGGIGVTTSLSVAGQLDEVELRQRVEQCRPTGFPNSQAGVLTVSGRGTWLDAEGLAHQEDNLVVLSVDPDDLHLAAEVAVFHDIWGGYDFRGLPHPEIQSRNAPRLAAALQALEALLDAPATPGDATYFGRAEGYGIEVPDVIDGRGPDLTDLF